MNDFENIPALKREIEALKVSNTKLRIKLQQAQNFCIYKEKKSIEYIYHLGRFKENIFAKAQRFIARNIKIFERKFSLSKGTDKSVATLQYHDWIKNFDVLSEDDPKKISKHIEALSRQPIFSLIINFEAGQEKEFDHTLQSLTSQLYKRWELIVVGDNEAIEDFSAKYLMQAPINAHIIPLKFTQKSEDKNLFSQLITSTKGDFIGFMNPGDTLSPEALYEFAYRLDVYRNALCLYSDEDVIDLSGDRTFPCFKTDWNLTLFLAQNYIGGLSFISRDSFIDALSQVCENNYVEEVYFHAFTAASPEQIQHISAPLFHRYSADGKAGEHHWMKRSCSLTQAYCDARRERIEISPLTYNPSWLRLRYQLKDPAPLVSIIIPTHNRPDLLSVCLSGIFEKTNYSNVQVIIVDHENTHPEVIEIFSHYKFDPRLTIMPFHGAFDHSLMNNLAAEKADGEILLFLNDDIEIIEGDWLKEIVSRLSQDDCGVVGARLIYPNKTIQHAGVILGYGGVAGHGHVGCSLDEAGYYGRLMVASEVSALTGACMAMRRELFHNIGGFSARSLQRTFNDVDLCLKARAYGKKNIFTPFATLIHHESATDGGDVKLKNFERLQREVEYMYRTWGLLQDDPHYNVNLSLDGASFSPSFPPRRSRPWQINEEESFAG